MWHKYVEPVLQWLYRVIREPRSELNRWQQTVRFSYDLGRYGARQLREDRASQMAAALSYQAMFALVPVLIVATIIVRAWSAEGFTEFIDSVLTTAGLSTFSAPGDGAAGDQTLAAWLEGLIGEAADIDLKAVGWIGFGVIVYAAINMLVTIENSFNIIYRAPGGRPWSRRIPLYWFMLTVGPIALILTAVLNQDVNAWLGTLGMREFFVDAGTKLWSVSVGWLFWFTVYTFVPNTSVNLKSSAIGALVAVILLELGKSFLGAFIAKSLSLNLVIGSLGLIPLFMFWVHLMCLAILFGLEVSATLQFLGDHAFEEMESRRESAGLIEPSIVVTAMQVVGLDFESGRPDLSADDCRPRGRFRETGRPDRSGTVPGRIPASCGGRAEVSLPVAAARPDSGRRPD